MGLSPPLPNLKKMRSLVDNRKYQNPHQVLGRSPPPSLKLRGLHGIQSGIKIPSLVVRAFGISWKQGMKDINKTFQFQYGFGEKFQTLLNFTDLVYLCSI